MEKFAKRLAHSIGELLNFDSEKVAVISYGLTALFQMAIIFTITSVIGLIGGFWYECMVLFIGVGILRKSVGGAHSETFIGCLAISIFTISFLAFMSRFLSHFLVLNHSDVLIVKIAEIIVFAFSFIIIFKLAPVASKNKPIVKPKKIKKLRRNAFITLFIFFAAAILFSYYSIQYNRFLSISFSFAFATLWQTFVLTGIGHQFIHTIDRKFTVEE